MSIRCSRCVLPGTIPYINFDEHGVCNYCREYDKNKSKIDINYSLKGKNSVGLSTKPSAKGSKTDPNMMPLSLSVGEGIVLMWHGN